MHKPVLICIIGPDNVGKTTLAKELTKLYRGQYIHFKSPRDDDDTRVAHYIEPLSSINSSFVIADRGGPEFFFYDTLRRSYGLNSFHKHNHIWLSKYKETFSRMFYFYINQVWNNKMIKRHMEEYAELELDNTVEEYLQTCELEHRFYAAMIDAWDSLYEMPLYHIMGKWELESRIEFVKSKIDNKPTQGLIYQY